MANTASDTMVCVVWHIYQVEAAWQKKKKIFDKNATYSFMASKIHQPLAVLESQFWPLDPYKGT